MTTILPAILSSSLLVVGELCLARPREMPAAVVRHYYRGWLKRVADLLPGGGLITGEFFAWELRLFGIACLIVSGLILVSLSRLV